MVLTIPYSAESERVYSGVKRVKVIERNCLDEDRLNDLLTIQQPDLKIKHFN